MVEGIVVDVDDDDAQMKLEEFECEVEGDGSQFPSLEYYFEQFVDQRAWCKALGGFYYYW